MKHSLEAVLRETNRIVRIIQHRAAEQQESGTLPDVDKYRIQNEEIKRAVVPSHLSVFSNSQSSILDKGIIAGPGSARPNLP